MEGHHIGGRQRVCGFGVTQPPVGGFANSPEGIPVLGADLTTDPEVAGITDDGFGPQGSPLFEVLFQARRFVVTGECGIDPFGQDPRAEGARSAATEPAVKDQHHLIGSADIEVIANHPFKPHPAGLGPVEDAGLGDFELTEGQVVCITGLPVGCGEGRG
jgi:hypothetical protein